MTDDNLNGEIEQTVATLRGEAEELRGRDIDAEDVAEQIERRADELEAEYEATFEDAEYDPAGEYAAKFNDRDAFRHDDLGTVFERAEEWFDEREYLTGDANVAVTIGPAEAIDFPEVEQPYHD